MTAGIQFQITDFTKVKAGDIRVGNFLYGADLNNLNHFSKMDSNLVLTDIEGTGGLVTYIPITFAELQAAIGGGLLLAGQKYIITDFTTIYDQPDFDAAGAPKAVVVTKTSVVEPLIVEANTTTTINGTVQSASFPTDQLQYDVNFTTTEYMGAAAKGRITQRIDSTGNKADYDFRTVLYLRYETAPASGDFLVINDNGNTTQEDLTFHEDHTGNKLGDFAIYLDMGFPFLLSNVVFTDDSFTNSTGDGTFNITFGSDTAVNHVGQFCNDILLFECEGCTTGAANSDIEFQDCTTCHVGDDNRNIKFDEGSEHCFVGNENADIDIGEIVKQLVIGNNNDGINIADECQFVSIGDNNETITLGIEAEKVTIGNSNEEIEVEEETENTFIGNDNQNVLVTNGCENISMQHGNEDIIITECENVTMLNKNENINFEESENITIGNGNTGTIGGGCENITAGNENEFGIVGSCEHIAALDGNEMDFEEDCSNITLGSGNDINLAGNCRRISFIDDNTLTLPENSMDNVFESNNNNSTFSAAVTNNHFHMEVLLNATNFAAATQVYASYAVSYFTDSNSVKVAVFYELSGTPDVNVVAITA